MYFRTSDAVWRGGSSCVRGRVFDKCWYKRTTPISMGVYKSPRSDPIRSGRAIRYCGGRAIPGTSPSPGFGEASSREREFVWADPNERVWSPNGFAQKILGGHRPPLQLGVRNCRGAL